MDYIQQAIEKAREKRELQGETKPSSTAVDKPTSSQQQSVEGANSLARGKKTSSLESINYTKTKSITLDDKWLKKQRVVTTSSLDRQGEPYRRLRTQVLQKLRSNNWKTLAVTSPGRGAGKTTTAVNLAISLSKEVNQTVMLVDLDMREPGVLRTFGINTDIALMDHLHGACSVSDILINPDLERLVILPSKKDPRYSSELLSSPAMKSLINDLTTRYESRIIIFDLPALLENDDALTFIPVVDAALLVIEDGVTNSEEIETSIQLLESTNIVGTVLNKAT